MRSASTPCASMVAIAAVTYARSYHCTRAHRGLVGRRAASRAPGRRHLADVAEIFGLEGNPGEGVLIQHGEKGVGP
jgi:hypothetical protein